VQHALTHVGCRAQIRDARLDTPLLLAPSAIRHNRSVTSMNLHATQFVAERMQATPLASGRAPVIAFEHVTKTFQPRDSAASVTALDDVSLKVPEGEILGIIGRSGAGKSTLVRVINGLEKPTSGRILVDGIALSDLPEASAREARRSIGMVFQHFNLLSSRTAAGNIALPLEIAGASRETIAARTSELLGLVGLTTQRDRYPSELSGGQKQRVGIARALAAKPKVLLCDEATSALDPETTAQILSLLARIRRELGVTIVIITHEMAVVKSIADRVAVLDHGKLVEQGPTFEIFLRPQNAATKAFVNSVTGIGIPEDIRARLIDAPVPGGSAILRILFSGPHAGEPVLSRLTQMTAADINILAGQVDSIAGHPFGTFIVTVPSEPAALSAVRAALAKLELPVEVLGYVP
jgi:D-methionine transport system ATP-binding protein